MCLSMVLQIFLKVLPEGNKELKKFMSIMFFFCFRLFGDIKPNLTNNDYSVLVIFIVGGITSHEIQLIHEYSQQLQKQVRKKISVSKYKAGGCFLNNLKTTKAIDLRFSTFDSRQSRLYFLHRH